MSADVLTSDGIATLRLDLASDLFRRRALNCARPARRQRAQCGPYGKPIGLVELITFGLARKFQSRFPILHAKGRDKRPGLDAMMKGVNAKEFQMVAALSIDRLGRSLTDLLAILQALHDKGVDLFLHQQGLDTSTSAGRAMFQMLGVFAEFERGIIRASVNAGLARARANGIRLRRRRIKPSLEARILELRDNGDGIHMNRKELK